MQQKIATKEPRKPARAAKAQGGGNSPPPPLSNNGRKALSKIEHIRAELASVYRAAKGKQIQVAEAGKLAYILSLLARIIEGSDLEARLEALEKVMEGNKQ